MAARYTLKVKGVEPLSMRYYRSSREVTAVKELGSSSLPFPGEPPPLALIMELGEQHSLMALLGNSFSRVPRRSPFPSVLFQEVHFKAQTTQNYIFFKFL